MVGNETTFENGVLKPMMRITGMNVMIRMMMMMMIISTPFYSKNASHHNLRAGPWSVFSWMKTSSPVWPS